MLRLSPQSSSPAEDLHPVSIAQAGARLSNTSTALPVLNGPPELSQLWLSDVGNQDDIDYPLEDGGYFDGLANLLPRSMICRCKGTQTFIAAIKKRMESHQSVEEILNNHARDFLSAFYTSALAPSWERIQPEPAAERYPGQCLSSGRYQEEEFIYVHKADLERDCHALDGWQFDSWDRQELVELLRERQGKPALRAAEGTPPTSPVGAPYSDAAQLTPSVAKSSTSSAVGSTKPATVLWSGTEDKKTVWLVIEYRWSNLQRMDTASGADACSGAFDNHNAWLRRDGVYQAIWYAATLYQIQNLRHGIAWVQERFVRIVILDDGDVAVDFGVDVTRAGRRIETNTFDKLGIWSESDWGYSIFTEDGMETLVTSVLTMLWAACRFVTRGGGIKSEEAVCRQVMAEAERPLHPTEDDANVAKRGLEKDEVNRKARKAEAESQVNKNMMGIRGAENGEVAKEHKSEEDSQHRAEAGQGARAATENERWAANYEQGEGYQEHGGQQRGGGSGYLGHRKEQSGGWVVERESAESAQPRGDIIGLDALDVESDFVRDEGTGAAGFGPANTIKTWLENIPSPGPTTDDAPGDANPISSTTVLVAASPTSETQLPGMGMYLEACGIRYQLVTSSQMDKLWSAAARCRLEEISSPVGMTSHSTESMA